MKQIDRTIKSQSEPKDLNVFWLDTSNPEEPILKEYDGGWKAVAGGGGSTGNAVSYDEQELTAEQQAQARTNIGAGTSNFNGNPVLVTEQELTDAQKMQARKNQGLYYSEGGGEDVTINWDGDTTGKDYFEDGHLYKISTDTPQAEQLKSFVLSATQSSESMTINIDEDDIISGDGYYGVVVTNPELGDVIFVCLAPEVALGGYTFTQGIWLYKVSSAYISQLVYGQTETINHIEPKYIEQATEEGNMDVRKRLGLYYEGEGIGEKTIINPSPEYDWEYPDSNFEYNYSTFKWFIGDAPTQSEIIGIRYNDSSTYILGNSLQSAVVEGSDGKAIMYAEDISDSSRRMFMVVSEDVSFGGSNHKKGIYFPDMPTDPYLYEIKYMGETTITHQIPAKYIPQTIPAVKIEVPSQNYEFYNIGHTVLNNWVRSRDVKFSVDIEGFHLSWLSIVNMSDPTNTIYGEMDSDTYTFTSAGSYLVTLNLVDSVYNSRNISAILVVIDIGS